jgi:hypothetical protein
VYFGKPDWFEKLVRSRNWQQNAIWSRLSWPKNSTDYGVIFGSWRDRSWRFIIRRLLQASVSQIARPFSFHTVSASIAQLKLGWTPETLAKAFAGRRWLAQKTLGDGHAVYEPAAEVSRGRSGRLRPLEVGPRHRVPCSRGQGGPPQSYKWAQ